MKKIEIKDGKIVSDPGWDILDAWREARWEELGFSESEIILDAICDETGVIWSSQNCQN